MRSYLSCGVLLNFLIEKLTFRLLTDISLHLYPLTNASCDSNINNFLRYDSNV